MNWNTQRGGPWGGGGGQGPWGGGGPSRPKPPDIEDLLRKSQDRMRQFLPSGGGGAKRLAILGVAAVIVWFATGFYRVEPDELGVELLFGKFNERTQPGLNWNFPTPIGQVYTPKVTRINAVQIGLRTQTDPRARGVTGRAIPEESLMLTGDENIIDIRFVAFWRIRDAQRFTLKIRNPEATVKAAAEAAMREVVGKSNFEYARTQGRTQIQQEVRVLLQQILDSYSAGIEITDINLQQVEPPQNVLDAFRDVQAARADKERAINEATAYLNEVVQQAEGEAARIGNEAEAYKQEKVALATGDTSRFLSVLEQYKVEKDVTRRRIYLETMRGVMGGMDKVLIDTPTGGQGVVPYLPLNELRNNTTNRRVAAPAPVPAQQSQPTTGTRR
jgi:membrane protease subunit HflK